MLTIIGIDEPGDAGHSPAYTEEADLEAVGTPSQDDYHQDTIPERDLIAVPLPGYPAPPSPSVGGEMGLRETLGWSTGLRNPSAFSQRFTGRTLVIPHWGVHPQIGPVGQSNYQQGLANGVAALDNDYTPSEKDVYASFFTARPSALRGMM